jgi:hypothetical protein
VLVTMRVVRLVLLLAIAAGLVEVVIGVASGATGALEKAVIVAFGVLLVIAASRVRRRAPKAH